METIELDQNSELKYLQARLSMVKTEALRLHTNQSLFFKLLVNANNEKIKVLTDFTFKSWYNLIKETLELNKDSNYFNSLTTLKRKLENSVEIMDNVYAMLEEKPFDISKFKSTFKNLVYPNMAKLIDEIEELN